MTAAQQELIRLAQELGAQAKAFREQFPDSPAVPVAFEISALMGQIEASVAATDNPPGVR